MVHNDCVLEALKVACALKNASNTVLWAVGLYPQMLNMKHLMKNF